MSTAGSIDGRLSSPSHTIKLAACHVSPHYLNPTTTTHKALSLIDQAASQGANLVCFPEAYIPGFPLFASTHAPIDHATLFSSYATASIYADGPEVSLLREKARECNIAVSIGFSERSRASVGCLWNANLLIGEDGEILVHHRKLQPTFWEKLVWSPGDGAGLVVGATARAGRVGALICGENTNPLARYSMMAQAEQVHVMSFPPVWPTARKVGEGYRNQVANRTRAAGHSFEGKCFSVVCAGFLGEEMKEAIAAGDESVRKVLDGTPQASSCFFGPDAVQIGDELTHEEGIAYCEVDLERCVEAKKLHDVVGGYQRFDVFDLQVTRKRDEPVKWK